MICKECGAYNPDHASFCKVCAASLKEDTAPKPVEEETQPTRRFSRPSWMASEQTEPLKPTVKEEVDTVDEAAEDEKTVSVPVEPENVPVHEEEETVVPIWSPSRSRMRPEPSDIDEEDEEGSPEPEESEESEEETESIYNDEEALEEDDDAFEYEPTPPKRKQNKKKNNTMFTVLLIAIIVVIVGILVIGGYMLLKNQLNCGKSPDKTGDAEQTSTQPVEQPETSAEPEATEAPALDAKNAQLQEMVDENGQDLLVFTVVIPAHATVEFYFPHQPNHTFTNDQDKDISRKVKVPPAVYYPNTPIEAENATMVFQPEIQIHNADGSSYSVNCPTFTRTFPKLELTVTEPIPEGDEPYMAPESNEVHIEGVINDSVDTEVTINGVIMTIYQGNVYMYDYKFADTATEDTVDTITITATKNNCVSDTKEIKLHAYKFIPEPMKLEVSSEGTSLRTDKKGKLTVTGKTLPGATLEAISDNVTNVYCGSVAVDAEGNFSFQISTEDTFYGTSVITLTANGEAIGADNGSTSFNILKVWADREAFVKYYSKTKSYIQIPKIDDLLANQEQYATNAYGFRITARVVEIITIDGETIVKLTNNKTNETVYVVNYSQGLKNVGELYNIWCSYHGTYSDTGCCLFTAWFAKNVK